MSREGSAADQSLLATLEERGVEGVTARKLERWRQRGLIPRAAQRGLGRSRGSVSVLPDGAVDQVEAAANAVARYGKIDEALMAMFAEGWRVNEQALKAAYVRQFEEIARWMAGQAPDDNDSLAAPEAGAQGLLERAGRTKQSRAWRRRLSGGDESADSVLLSAFTALLHVFQTGEPSSMDALEEALRAGGVDRMWLDQLEGVGAVVPDGHAALDDIVALLTGADFEGWVAAVEEATWEELREALDAIRSLAGLFNRLSAMNEVMLGNRDAFGFGVFAGLGLEDPQTAAAYVPVMLMVRRRVGGAKVDKSLDQILVAGRQLQEAEALIEAASGQQLDQARDLAHELLIIE